AGSFRRSWDRSQMVDACSRVVSSSSRMVRGAAPPSRRASRLPALPARPGSRGPAPGRHSTAASSRALTVSRSFRNTLHGDHMFPLIIGNGLQPAAERPSGGLSPAAMPPMFGDMRLRYDRRPDRPDDEPPMFPAQHAPWLDERLFGRRMVFL